MKRGVLLIAGLLCSAPAAAKPVKIEQDTKALEFSYSWPAEAAVLPALDRRLRSDMEKALREARSNAREDEQLARSQKRDFNAHYYSMLWTTAGETPRLLSLQSENGSFEGGAHPNTSYGALLWDRRARGETNIKSLFLLQGDFGAHSHRLLRKTRRRTGEEAQGRKARSRGVQRLPGIFGSRDCAGG